MAKNVTIANVDYSNVPSIEVPLTAGGGNAKFVEISATTATADKILTGYGAYSSSGVWMDGTATQGGGSSKNAQIWSGYGKVQNAGYIAVPNMTIKVAKTGTYDVYWCGYRSSTSGTWGSRLYINNTGYGNAFITTFDEETPAIQIVHLSGVSLNADDVLTVKARSRGSNYIFYIFDLVIIEQ